jgi:cytochrome c-type biogenesis protein CcmF
VEVKVGDAFQLGRYELRVLDLKQGETSNYSWDHAVIGVSAGGTSLGTLEPERRFYTSSQQGSSEVSIRRRLNEDLYLNFAGMNQDNTKAVIQAYVFPLVSWIWIGFWVLVMGTLICLVPSRVWAKARPGEPESVEELALVER